MEGAPKRPVNAEEMLAELKRALESPPNAPAPSASTAAKSRSAREGIGRSRIDNGSDRPAQANARKSIGPQTDLQRAVRLRVRSWKLAAGGLALAGVATISVSFALMNKAPNPAEREPSFAAPEGRIRPSNEQTLEPSSSPRASLQGNPQAAPLHAGALETRPEAGTAPATGGSFPALGKAEADASHLVPPDLDSAAPAITPALLNQAPALAPSVRIGPDGAPISTTPSTPSSTDSARQAETPNPAAAPAASQMVKPDQAPMPTTPSIPSSTAPAPPAETPSRAAAPAASQMAKPDRAPIPITPSTPASIDSGRQAETPSRAAAPAASQMAKPDGAPMPTTPSIPSSTASAPPAETPNQAAAPAASQMAKPDGARIATAPPAPASTDSTPQAETPKPNATPTGHVSNESTQPSIRKTDSKKKPPEKTSTQKPLRSPTPPVKPIAHAERQRTEPARPKEAEQSPEPTQGAGNPAQVAPVAAPSVPQRVADGVTHAFGYLVHLPGALVPHFGDANPDAH
jgi:hypothetical protein